MPRAIRCFKTGGPCTVDVQEKPHSVFVIMPFAEAFDDVYDLGIKASVEALGWECRRADEVIHNLFSESSCYWRSKARNQYEGIIG